MGGKITSALSPETRDLLKQNQFFYESVTKLFDQTQLMIKGRDAEAQTEVELLHDGNLAVHVILPLDANDSASDGRIYLRDTFVFDAKQKELHSHKRSFEYNGRGENKAEWRKWLDQYKTGSVPTGQAVQAFAAGVARSFDRPFQDKHAETFKANSQFYSELLGAGVERGLTLKLRDTRSSYAILHRGLVNEIVFTLALTDNEGRPGHLEVKESFLIDANTQALVGYKRRVEPAPESVGSEFWRRKAEAFRELSAPEVGVASAFIAHFLPDMLTDAPEFKSEVAPPPAQGYPEMSQADFQKVMGGIARSRQATPMAEIDPDFFKTLDAAQAYLDPLRTALGSGFELNLKDPSLQTSVQVQKGKTQVFVTYALKPRNGEAGVLEYSERWTFEKGELTAVDRQAKALGAPVGGEVEAAAIRIQTAIREGEFGDAKQEATWRAVVAQAGYLAPHLSYVGLPNILQQNPEQASLVHQMVLPMMEEIQADLVSVLYQNEADPRFREDLLRMNAAWIHGDQQVLVESLTRLQQREEKALASAESPEKKRRHQENLRVSNLVFSLTTGDLEKAHEISKLLVSPAYKNIFTKPLGYYVRMGQVSEGITLIGKVVEEQIEVGRKTEKGWLADSPKYAGADQDVLPSLVMKAMSQAAVSRENLKSADSLELFRLAMDFGKDKKPEEMKEEEKRLLLTGAERALAEKILADPLVKKLAHIAAEEDKDLQAKEYFEFARGGLFERGLFQSSRFLVQSVVAYKMPKTGTAESLELLRAYAMEKSENEKNSKLEAMPQPPQETQALGSLLQKLSEQAQEDPAKPVLQLLSGLSGLSEDEKRLVMRLQNSPGMKKISEAASLATVEERFAVYQQVIQPFMTDQALLDDVIAQLEKDPKLGLKQVFEKIPGLTPIQGQLLQLLEQQSMVPEIDQKLAVAVTMPEAERDAYYRKHLVDYLPNLMIAQEIDQALRPFTQVDNKAQIQAFEGTTLAAIVLSGEIEAELRPQTKQAQVYARASGEEFQTVQSLIEKAELLAPMHPNAGALGVLRELKEEDLSPAERDMRRKLLEDKVIAPLLEIGAEPDLVKRHQAYLAHTPDFEKGEPAALGKAGFPQTEMYLAQQLHMGKIPDVQSHIEMPALSLGQQPDRRHFAAAGAMEHQEKLSRDVRKFLAMLEGKGDFGSKVGYSLPHFSKELTKPTTLAAMMAAPLVGGATQLVVFNRLKNLGMIGKGVAVGLGVGAEAATFTYLHAKGEKHVYGNDALEKNFWNDLKTNAMLFAAMRGAHLGTAAFGEKVLATGKLGKWGGGYVAGESAGSLKVLPTKQLVYLPSGGGVGVPQLTVAGERVVGLLHHGGALAAMHASSQLSHKVGWQEHAPSLDDTLMMYMQAMAGYSLANSASGGRLSRGMADFNMRMGNVSGGHSVEGVRQRIAELKAEKDRLGTDKASLSDAAKREIDSKIHKIDGQVLKLEKKLDGLQGSGKKSDDSQADLIQLFEKRSEALRAEPSFQDVMAEVPRAQQLSLARQVAKAKTIEGLFKILRDSPHGGAGEVMALTAEVLAGRISVESVPVELGLQTKVKSLLEGQIRDWKKSGLSIEGYTLKEDAIPAAELSKLEAEYHTLRAIIALKAGVEGSRTVYDLFEAIGRSPLQTIEGKPAREVFNHLTLEGLRSLLDSSVKSEAEMREKIRLADRAILREKKAWKKTDKEVVAAHEKIRAELVEKADGLKAFIEQLKIGVAAGEAVAEMPGGRSFAELVRDLPRELGIRQKAQDTVEQSQGEFAKSLSEKEKQTFIDFTKRYLSAGEVSFDQAQSLLRSLWDGGHWQGTLLLRRLKPEQLELALKVYFGSSSTRDLSPEQAFRMAQLLSEMPVQESFSVVLSMREGASRLELVRGGIDISTAVQRGDVIVLGTHTGKMTPLDGLDLVALGKQAKQVWWAVEGAESPTSHRRSTSPHQLSDSQLYFDAETRSYQTWISHPQALSKVRVTLDTAGEVEAIQVKIAPRPGHQLPADFKLPQTLHEIPEWSGKESGTISVERQTVDYQALVKELPFEFKAPGFAFNTLAGMAKLRDRVPAMPKLTKRGEKPSAEATPPKSAPADAAKSEPASVPALPPVPVEPPAPKPAAAKPASGSSFFRGPLGWLSGKLPKFGGPKRPAKPAAEAQGRVAPQDSSVPAGSRATVPPPVAPPKAEGTRPTLPQNLQFPPAQIGMGERGVELAHREIAQSANKLMGEYAGRTHEGVGRPRNEDGIGMAYTAERDLVLLAVDGMGGHGNGKEAAQVTLEVATREVQVKGGLGPALVRAHDQVIRDLHPGAIKNMEPGAGVGAVKIRRPDSPTGPSSMEASWGGDVSIVVLRQGRDGKRHWVYRNAEDNLARQYVDMAIESGRLPREGRDLQIISHPHANRVNNVIGSPSGFTPRRTQEGLVPGPDGFPKQATGLERLALERGDVVLILPDGTSKNLKDLQVLIDLISGKESAQDIAKTLDAWVAERMKTVERIEQAYEKGGVLLDEARRQSFVVEGVERFMDERGSVYERAEGGKPIDHYEADNFSVMVYVHNPETGVRAKADSNPGFQTPSNTKLSDPDQTQIFRRPGGSDSK